MGKDKVLILGAGYSGLRIAQLLLKDKAEVIGTSRTSEGVAKLESFGLKGMVFNADTLEKDLTELFSSITHLISTIAPGQNGDPVLEFLSKIDRKRFNSLKWMGYLSTVGVYGEYNGDWVDETSPCHPVNDRSRWRLEAETDWHIWAEKLGVPVAILRLSGIYGPGRNPFKRLDEGNAIRIIKPDLVFNRIHVDDIAGAVQHLMKAGLSGVFNVSDDEPAPPQDVVFYAASLMGIAPPPEVPYEKAVLSPMARSFYEECKRVSNAKIKNTGYQFKFSNYRDALSTMWHEKLWLL